jgi:hypothetical protein
MRPQILRMGADMAAQARRRRGSAQRKARPAAAAQAKPKTPDAPAPTAVPEPELQPATRRPVALGAAAAAQAIEAAGVGVAAIFAAVATADGKSHEVASGVAITVIALAAAAGIAAIAAGLAKVRPWSRTPAVMTQLFVVIAGITLLDGNRTAWGVPALVLAAVCVAGLLAPASLRALNRPPAKTSSVKGG